MIKNPNKALLRNYIANELKKIPMREKSELSVNIEKRVLMHPHFVSSDMLLIYYPLRSEVDTRLIIEAAFSLHKEVALPRIVGNELEFHIISDGYEKNLIKSSFGSLEPPPHTPMLNIDQYTDILLVVPGVAFSLSKERLGRAKGFYDRFINRYREYMSVMGICFDVQLLDSIIVESWDEKVDFIITEKRVIA